MFPVVQEHVNNAFSFASARKYLSDSHFEKMSTERKKCALFLLGWQQILPQCLCSILVPSTCLCQPVAWVALTWINTVRADPVHQMFDRCYQVSTANAVL